MSNYRNLCEIADEIYCEWANVNYAAAPYLSAMSTLRSINDNYMMDSGKSVVLYFLCNASSFRGPAAKRIKAELKAMCAGKPVPVSK
jgi:hypothetical protein